MDTPTTKLFLAVLGGHTAPHVTERILEALPGPRDVARVKRVLDSIPSDDEQKNYPLYVNLHQSACLEVALSLKHPDLAHSLWTTETVEAVCADVADEYSWKKCWASRRAVRRSGCRAARHRPVACCRRRCF